MRLRSAVFHSHPEYEIEPYTFEATSCLRVETEAGISVFPYLRLEEITYQDTDSLQEEGQLDLIFDSTVIRVKGFRVQYLLTPLQRQTVFSPRVGISTNPENPKISSIEVIQKKGF